MIIYINFLQEEDNLSTVGREMAGPNVFFII